MERSRRVLIRGSTNPPTALLQGALGPYSYSHPKPQANCKTEAHICATLPHWRPDSRSPFEEETIGECKVWFVLTCQSEHVPLSAQIPWAADKPRPPCCNQDLTVRVPPHHLKSDIHLAYTGRDGVAHFLCAAIYFCNFS